MMNLKKQIIGGLSLIPLTGHKQDCCKKRKMGKCDAA